jgi:hypothetical protein
VILSPLFWPRLVVSGLDSLLSLFIRKDEQQTDADTLDHEPPCSEHQQWDETSPQNPFPNHHAEAESDLMHEAESVQQLHEQAWTPAHTYEKVSARDFKHLDLKHYESFRKNLVAFGFTHLGDIEITSMSSPMIQRTMVRMMLSPERMVQAATFHCKSWFWLRVLTFFTPARAMTNCKSIDFETEFQDGSFVITTSSPAAANFDHPSVLNSQALPGCELKELGRRHYERVQEHARQNHCEPIVLSDLESAMASQARLHAIKSNGRPESGMTRSEFRRASRSDGAEVDQLYDAWQMKRAQTIQCSPQ